MCLKMRISSSKQCDQQLISYYLNGYEELFQYTMTKTMFSTNSRIIHNSFELAQWIHKQHLYFSVCSNIHDMHCLSNRTIYVLSTNSTIETHTQKNTRIMNSFRHWRFITIFFHLFVGYSNRINRFRLTISSVSRLILDHIQIQWIIHFLLFRSQLK